MMPRFSLVIPTRNRKATLRYALASALQQPRGDVEIVVADNATTDGTSELASEYPMVRWIRSDTPLPMRQNWERALAAASGEWICFIGDDDAFLPDCVSLASGILDRYDAEIFAWPTPKYYWPDALHQPQRNRLDFTFGTGLAWAETRPLLQLMYTRFKGLGGMPGLYHHFIRRRLIDRIVGRLGHYPLGISPDIGSALINLGFADRILHLDRPLTTLGYSGASTGYAFKYFSEDGGSRSDFVALEAGMQELLQRYPLAELQTNAAYVLRLMLWARDLMRPAGIAIDVDMARFVKWQATTLGTIPVPERPAARARLNELCRGIGLPELPADPNIMGAEPDNRYLPYLIQGAKGRIEGRFDFTDTPITNVFDAAKILGGLLPKVELA